MNYADKQFRDAVAITQDIAIQLGDYVLNVVEIATWFAIITIVLIVVLSVLVYQLADRLSQTEKYIDELCKYHFRLRSDVLKLHKDELES